jgi:hypothetical protein
MSVKLFQLEKQAKKCEKLKGGISTRGEHLYVVKDKKEYPIVLMFKRKAKGFRNLKRFGEICVVTTRN